MCRNISLKLPTEGIERSQINETTTSNYTKGSSSRLNILPSIATSRYGRINPNLYLHNNNNNNDNSGNSHISHDSGVL